MATFNEALYALMQALSPDEPSAINEEIIEAGIEAEVVNAGNVDASLMGLARKILGLNASPGTAKKALLAAAETTAAVRLTEQGNLRETENAEIRRVE